MSQPQVLLLKNRAACALVSLCFLTLSGWSWALIAKGVQHRVDFVTALFSCFSILFFAYYAYKSPFWADRIVLGACGGISTLIAVRYATLPPLGMLAANVAKASLYTIAGVISLVTLANGFNPSSNHPTSQGEGPREI